MHCNQKVVFSPLSAKDVFYQDDDTHVCSTSKNSKFVHVYRFVSKTSFLLYRNIIATEYPKQKVPTQNKKKYIFVN